VPVTAKYTQPAHGAFVLSWPRSSGARFRKSFDPLFEIVETVKALDRDRILVAAASWSSCERCAMLRSGHTASAGNPGPIGPIGPLCQENSMETKAWHHRQQDPGAVLSGPIVPLCAILAPARRKTRRRPAMPGYIGYIGYIRLEIE
jgi:hypothetical protein